MVDRPSWAPRDVALEEPSIARIWDWFLGGSHNFPADREVARRTLELMPEAPRMAQISRAFLRRAVRHCAAAGIDQFLDLGSGIPTVGSVHEVAQRVNPRARVVYVDRDAVAVAHTRQILDGNLNAGVVQADLREPEQVLAAPQTAALLDLARPIAVLMISVLHFVADADDPAGITARYGAALASGSMLAIAHGSRETEGMPTDHLHSAREAYQERVAPVSLRTRSQVRALFGPFAPVDPGVVWLTQWHPDPNITRDTTDLVTPQAGYGGVGVKR